MNIDWLNGATQRERDQFKSVCKILRRRIMQKFCNPFDPHIRCNQQFSGVLQTTV